MSVLAKIQKSYKDLTNAQRKVADYIYQNVEYAAMQTATQICLETGVSDTTVIRLAYSLGFRSFSEMQRQMKQDILEKVSAPEETSENANRMQQMFNEDIEILRRMRDGLIDYKQIQGIARRLYEADRIIIFGYYGEHTVSFELYLMLDSIRPNVYYFRKTSDGYREAMQLTEKSVVIAVSLEPYALGTLRCIREMREYKPYVVSFTDSALCELAQEADENVTVTVGSDSITGTNRMGPVMSLFYVLFREVVLLDPDSVMKRLSIVPSRLVQPKADRFLVD